jgi:hypothetical protein
MLAWFVPPIVIPAVLVTLVFALALYQLSALPEIKANPAVSVASAKHERI